MVDILVICSFAVFALLCHLGRWNGVNGFVFLSSDAANIASFVAARDNPQFFGSDPTLGDPENFRFYWTVQIPIVRFLARMTGDYGNAIVTLLGPVIFLQAVGFYIFGRVVLTARYLAILFAIITLMPMKLNLGTYWGIFLDPLPRSFFQSLLPFLLAAVYYWRTTPKVWPWLTVAAGALMYVHPVSTPGWGFAIWLGMWLFMPNSWSYAKRFSYMMLLGALFLASISPFLVHYLSFHAHGQTSNYELVYDIMKMRFSRGSFDIPEAFMDFIWEIRYVIFLAIVGAVITFRFRQSDRRKTNLLLIWIMGLLLISVFVPLVEQRISLSLGRIPFEKDLIRGMRYTIPLLMLFWLLPLVRTEGRTRNPILVCTVGLILTFSWAHNKRGWDELPSPNTALQALENWFGGYFVREPEEHMALRTTLENLSRLAPIGSRILPLAPLEPPYTFSMLAVRYFCLRPIVYSFKDGGTFAYSNHDQLIEWYEKVSTFFDVYVLAQRKISEKDYDSMLNLFVELAKKWNAQFLLIRLDIDLSSPATLRKDVLYADHGYLIVKITDRRT